ncbi:MAG: DUF2791 family P-loop domain-containing protein, partial [Actinobacteria bacterium]|nr:DUF2791 family P-loop domain-containing protein [Actinomycetota bacterium]
MPSPARRREIVDALRRGTVPAHSLDAFAVGVQRFAPALDEELRTVAGGAGVVKAVRGEYGSGKTFFARWLAERARRAGLATTEVQISETETPLHRLETVYRRLIERLATSDEPAGALRAVVERWGFALEEDVLARGEAVEGDEAALLERTNALAEARLGEVSRRAPAFATALRAHRAASARGDRELAEGILAWVGGQPNVPAAVKRAAGGKGEIDHFGARSFLQGLVAVLREAGHPGRVVVLDEGERRRRVGSVVGVSGVTALRQLGAA